MEVTNQGTHVMVPGEIEPRLAPRKEIQSNWPPWQGNSMKAVLRDTPGCSYVPIRR